MTNNKLSTQRINTAIDWTNNKATCNRRTLIDRIVTCLNIRANDARFDSEAEYQRIMKQVQKISTVSDNELAQYAIDLNITIMRIN